MLLREKQIQKHLREIKATKNLNYYFTAIAGLCYTVTTYRGDLIINKLISLLMVTSTTNIL